MKIGQRVKLVRDPRRQGVILEIIQENSSHEIQYIVQWDDGQHNNVWSLMMTHRPQELFKVTDK